jgi:P27 family predicted phage terminase small subunit
MVGLSKRGGVPMGKRGPKPTPLAIKQQRGSRVRPNEAGIDAPKGMPQPPPDMNPTVRYWWDYYCEILYNMGVLTVGDRMSVLRLAQATVAVNAANKIIEQSGSVMRQGGKKNKKGEIEGGYYQISPFLTARSKAWKEEQQLLSDFGLTPASRTRINLPAPSSPKIVNEEIEARSLID